MLHGSIISVYSYIRRRGRREIRRAHCCSLIDVAVAARRTQGAAGPEMGRERRRGEGRGRVRACAPVAFAEIGCLRSKNSSDSR